MNRITWKAGLAGARAAGFAPVAGAAAMAAAGLLAGCSDGPAARPLTADSFVNKPARDVGNPVDRPGPLMYDTIHQSLLPAPRQPSEPVRDISLAVRDNVRAPAESVGTAAGGGGQTPALGPAGTPPTAIAPPTAATPTPARADVGSLMTPAGRGAAAAPATAPTTGPAPGTYVTLGAVLVDVNSRPIFTDRILRE